jgi:hypothetical protein
VARAGAEIGPSSADLFWMRSVAWCTLEQVLKDYAARDDTQLSLKARLGSGRRPRFPPRLTADARRSGWSWM